MAIKNIDQVVRRMESILEQAIRDADRRGYFAALYYRVTCAVRDAIEAGAFQDNARMDRFDVAFAGRYFDALDTRQRGELPSRSWLAAFQVDEGSDYAILQHLLMGMNAHINLDLGVAAARLCPGGALQTLEGDFRKINEILSSMVPMVDTALDTVCPGYRALSALNPQLEQALISSGMNGARDLAWRFACELAPLPISQQVSALARKDLEVRAIGEGLERMPVLSRLLRLRESPDVARNIEALATIPLPGAPPSGFSSPSQRRQRGRSRSAN